MPDTFYQSVPNIADESLSALDRASRQYAYSPGPHTFFPFLDPLVILASLAFLAFILQTFHALYLFHHSMSAPSRNPGLLGGVVESLVPTKHRTMQARDQHFNDILTAIKLYQSMHRRRRKRPPRVRESTEQDEVESTILIPVNSTLPYQYPRK